MNLTYFVLSPLVVLAVLVGCSRSESPVNSIVEDSDAVSFHFNCPDSIAAGSELSFPGVKECDVFLQATWGTVVLEQKDGLVKLQKEHTEAAGVSSLIMLCNKSVVAKKTITILPGLPANTLQTYLGQKSITADNGKSWSMIVAIPSDKYHNSPLDGADVTFNIKRPNGSTSQSTIPSKNGVAYQKIYSQKKVGKTLIGSQITKLSVGQEKVLLEEPGYPVSFEIKADKVFLFADSRQYFRVRTSRIKDEHGNTVTDGTLISFMVEDVDGSWRRLTASTVDGIAEISIQNPILEGDLKIYASVYRNVLSNSISLFFKANLRELILYHDKERQELQIGPLTGGLGQLIPDGTEVQISFSELSYSRSLETLNGKAVLDLKSVPKGTLIINVKVAGEEKVVRIVKGS